MTAPDAQARRGGLRNKFEGWFLIFATAFLVFAFTADMWKLHGTFARGLDVFANVVVGSRIIASIYRDRINP